MTLIDIYTHIYPNRFFEEMSKTAPQLENLGKRLRSVKKLFDLDERFREMDEYGDYRQIISLPNPPIEDIAKGDTALNLARVANDSMAELCAKHPDRFPGFVAALAMTEIDGSIEGGQARHRPARRARRADFHQCRRRAAGRSEIRADLCAAMAQYDLPLWLHPVRTAAMPDYPAEKKSRFEMWWCFGWPYDTSVAMARLVFAGLFDRHPGIKIITHHCGGMIPYYDGRVGPGLAVLGARTSDEDYSKILPSLKRPHMDYFHDFYADTAMFGGGIGVKCGLEFFGPGHVVFATDAPLGPIGPTIKHLDKLELSDTDRKAVMSGNAAKLMKMKPS